MMYLLTAIGLTPLAVIQYTFTHKQYTEQHNETQYLERNIYNDKNT
jgi:cell division protein FtsL